jgi:4,5-DOPA dioxygenase extradiol
MSRLPTLFISHGSPMRAIEPGEAGKAWIARAHALPRPRAVLIASAHWESAIPLLTGSENPETVHDFGGFPRELYALEYATSGAPDLAAKALALLAQAGIAAGVDRDRGLDHGAWVPLRWMYPKADIPVVELSVQPALDPAHHLRVGRALQPLTAEGVLVIGSGHTTHNLRDWMASPRGSTVAPYAQAFATWLHDKLNAGDTDALLAYRDQAPEAARAHPSEEHFLPLFVALGAAGGQFVPQRFAEGFEGGSLALDSYMFTPSPARLQ